MCFKKLDTDKDGFISLEEFKPWYTESETRLKVSFSLSLHNTNKVYEEKKKKN